MTLSKLGEIIVKAFALFYFVKTIEFFFKQLVPMLFVEEQYDTYMMVWFLVSILCFGIASILLWVFSKPIGCKIAGSSKEKVFTSIDFDKALQLLLIGFGLSLLGPVIRELSGIFIYRIAEESKIVVMDTDWANKFFNLIPQTVIALLFIFKSSGLKSFIMKARTAGTK